MHEQEKISDEGQPLQATTLETLLGLTPPAQRTAKVRLRQLSESAGQEVVFSVRALSYDRVREIRQQESGENGRFAEAVILAGVTEPSLRDDALLKRYHALTPYELLPKLLSAGEIEELSSCIEQLSGYRMKTVDLLEDVKKN